MSENCHCPGPNDVSSTGCCDRCGYDGTKREEAIRAALASGRSGLAKEIGRQEGLFAGYKLGVERARNELLAEFDPDHPKDLDLEMG